MISPSFITKYIIFYTHSIKRNIEYVIHICPYIIIKHLKLSANGESLNMNGQSYKMVVSTIKESNASLYIDQTSHRHWQLQEGEKITVTAGQRSILVDVYSFSSNKSECKLSSAAAQYLSLPEFHTSISITFYRPFKKLVIGPFFAILMNQTLLTNGSFGEMEIFFQEMNTYCLDRGLPFYVTSLQSLQDNILTGFWPTAKGWESLKLPLADVFYNRIHSRQLEKSTLFQQFTTELQNYQIPMFNACFLSKFDVHTLLVNEESLLPHIPETILFQHKDDFSSFIQNRPITYLKPIFGSQGRSIGKVTRQSEGFRFEHSDDVNDIQLVKSDTELFTVLRRFCKNRSFILQKGISLLEWEYKKVDFRVLLHQSKEQDWKVTSMMARIGDTGHIVSNVARGAEMKNGNQFLKEKFDHSQALKLQHRLFQLAKKTAQHVNNQHHGLFAELGIDLAFDQDLHPWIIEVNSKPSKKFEGQYEKVRPSVKAIVHYMRSLSAL